MFKKLREYITTERVIGFGIILVLLTHLYFHLDLVLNKTKNPSLLDTVNSFIVLITLSIISLFFYSFFFQLITKDAHSVEKWALKNLTKVCYFIIILLGISFIQKYLTIEQFLTSIGATVVFWYGYKKYERDKEIDLIKNYSERYNNIKDDLDSTLESKNKIYNKLITLWYEEFFLSQKGYISEDLWLEWEHWMDEDIDCFLIESHKIFNENVQEKDLSGLIHDDWYAFIIDNSNFFDVIFMTYLEFDTTGKKKLYKDIFGNFIIGKIEKKFRKREKLNYLNQNPNWIQSMNSFFISINK